MSILISIWGLEWVPCRNPKSTLLYLVQLWLSILSTITGPYKALKQCLFEQMNKDGTDNISRWDSRTILLWTTVQIGTALWMLGEENRLCLCHLRAGGLLSSSKTDSQIFQKHTATCFWPLRHVRAGDRWGMMSVFPAAFHLGWFFIFSSLLWFLQPAVTPVSFTHERRLVFREHVISDCLDGMNLKIPTTVFILLPTSSQTKTLKL